MGREKITTFTAKNLDTLDLTGNYRDTNEESVLRLMSSIKEVGVKEPITVVEDGDKYLLISGFHRVAAVKRLTEEYPHIDISVQANVIPRDSDIAVKKVISNSLRHESVIDKAKGAAYLRDAGKTVKQIAEMLGKERMTIDNWLKLDQLYRYSPDFVLKIADEIGRDALLYKLAAKYARDGKIDLEKELATIKTKMNSAKSKKVDTAKKIEEILTEELSDKKLASSIIQRIKKAKLI